MHRPIRRKYVVNFDSFLEDYLFQQQPNLRSKMATLTGILRQKKEGVSSPIHSTNPHLVCLAHCSDIEEHHCKLSAIWYGGAL
jgi:hypothetical protein